MLKTEIPRYYIVKPSQTVEQIARAFSLPPSLIVSCNGLKEQPHVGQILRIPKARGNLYTVRLGDTKELLSGSKEAFEKKNGTHLLYPGQRVFL